MTKKNNQAAAAKLKSCCLTVILWRFGIKFAACWPRKEGARLIEGHFNSFACKFVRGGGNATGRSRDGYA